MMTHVFCAILRIPNLLQIFVFFQRIASSSSSSSFSSWFPSLGKTLFLRIHTESRVYLWLIGAQQLGIGVT